MRTRTTLAVALLAAALAGATLTGKEPVIGGPCEGCELVFVGMPDNLSSRARISGPNEPGEPLVIEGTVRNADGTPAPGVVVYAYHTDAAGIYPRGETRHGALRGWAVTAADGTYRFGTIRPASYPNSRAPQHVHMHVIEPGLATYYIDDIHFEDDPLLGARERNAARPRGGSGIVRPVKDSDRVWRVRRDITLRLHVP